MNVTGIIAEYNPFHNGHAYQIAEARKRTDADYVIVILSGDFVQRGEPAILDKYVRTHAALACGADLVLMLPVTASTASAENFAASGIGILHALGVVTHLSFGTEAADAQGFAFLKKCVPVLINEPDSFRETLAAQQKTGAAYPAARAKALLSAADPAPLSEQQALSLLKEPNTILALEYLKQLSLLQSPVIPVPISRKSGTYHSAAIDGAQPSAAAIRAALLLAADDKAAKAAMPDVMYEELVRYAGTHRLLCADDFSQMLFYAVQSCILDENQTLRIPHDLYRRICRTFEEYSGWSSYAGLLKSKNITYTAVSRTLTAILLGITARERAVMDKFMQAPYARILGFKKEAAPLLKQIAQNSRIPVITRPAAAAKVLDPQLRMLFERDIAASALYRYAACEDAKRRQPDDYRQPLVIL